MVASELVDASVSDMPVDAQGAFSVYLLTTAGGGRRSLLQTAKLTNIAPGTIRSWAFRYDWADRALKIDVEEGRASLVAAIVAAASQRVQIIATLREIAFDDPGAKRTERLAAIKQLREIAGLTGATLERFLLMNQQDMPVEGGSVTTDQLEAMVTEGRTEDLLALVRKG